MLSQVKQFTQNIICHGKRWLLKAEEEQMNGGIGLMQRN